MSLRESNAASGYVPVKKIPVGAILVIALLRANLIEGDHEDRPFEGIANLIEGDHEDRPYGNDRVH